MNTASLWYQPRRVGALVTAGAMLLQTALPAFAAVSQNPLTYVTQPDPNVMFTLDDSLSMYSDAIPDIFPGAQGTMPSDTNSSAVAGWGARFPNMWGSGSAWLTAANYRSSNGFARYFRSAAGNPLYYNPQVSYSPWPLAANNTATHPNATPRRVNIHFTDPFDVTRQLDIRYQLTDASNNQFWPATYFVYNGSTPMPLGQWNNSQNVASAFTRYEITTDTATTFPRHANRVDCLGTLCTRDEELQNFANWLQYYRNRMLMTKGGIADAFARQLTNLRVGFGTINTAGVVRNNQGVRQFSGQRRIDFFTDLYSVPGSTGGTPLRRAMDDVGRYFSRTDTSNPYAYVPGTTRSPEYSCRRSFHILSTDGYWNSNPVTLPVSAPDTQDQDNFAGKRTPIPAGGTAGFDFTDTPPAGGPTQAEQFTVNPFRDVLGTSTANASLSDIAAHYWLTDLRPTLDNNVPPSRRDPAFWQHLTMFTVGLGINGTGMVRRNSDSSTTVPASEPATSPFYNHRGKTWLADEQVRDLLVARKTGLDWTTPLAESAETGDDLIRAAMVGRGRYFSATDPTSLSNGLTSALLEATASPLSQSNLAVWSQELRADNRVYQATFSPQNWYGRLYSFNQGINGVVNTDPALALWEASNSMPAPDNRSIFTWNTDLSSPAASLFTWAGLNPTQQGHLNNDQNVLNYLRGDGSREVQNGGGFRDRSRFLLPGGSTTPGVLGDIVNSSPVKGSPFGVNYERLPAGAAGQDNYESFRGSPILNANINTVFVGANDGMLHAFNSETGVERFAFVPNSVFNVPRSLSGGNERKLLMLSQPAYEHRFTVDGSPQLGDAYVGSSALASNWRVMLTASTGAGARAVFALDATNPVVDASGSGFGTSNIRWELSEAHATHGADLGYVLNYPHIARMANGQFAAIFGNGYDSATGRAALFIVDLWTGAVIRKIPVGPTPALNARKNGLSQPNFTLRNRTVQYIYAGDLYGNLWKFDVTSTDPNNWVASFGGTPLYSTQANQPITSMPALGFQVLSNAPDATQPMVIFGTGQFWDTGDTSSDPVQNINLRNTQMVYGIWDKGGETTGFSGLGTLQRQDFDSAAGASATGLTATTNNPVNFLTQRGWYLALRGNGERIHINAQLPISSDRDSPVLLIANTPAAAVPCTGGGTGAILALHPYNGGNDPDNSSFVDLGFNVVTVTRGILTQPVVQFQASSGAGSPPSKGCDGRTGVNAGGREECLHEEEVLNCIPGGGAAAGTGSDNLLVGVSDTSTESISFGRRRPPCPGRTSWRQIQ